MQQTNHYESMVSSAQPSFNIIFDLRDVLFLYHPQHRGTPAQFTVIKDMAIVLHQIHAQTNKVGRPRHRLFVLSNATQDSYHNFITYHPEIFSYFEGIVVSAFSGFQKPDEQAYMYLVDKYNLDPHSCIFIDDKYENVASARSVGMEGIVCTTPTHVKEELKKYKVL